MTTSRLTRPFKKILLFNLLLFLILILVFHQWAFPISYISRLSQRPSVAPASCSPGAYASGHWQKSARYDELLSMNMTQPHDSIIFSGFTGCASPCDFCNWRQLAADNEQQYDRFPRAQSYEWAPGERCTDLRQSDPEQLVRDLVEDGGWYLVGDSVSENHFFSLSCLLFGHVIATPDYTLNEHWERDYPQNLYLSPKSPLIPSIKFPQGFDIAKTPLVSFKRIDVLLSKQELIDIHQSIQPPDVHMIDNTLFSADGLWTTSVHKYFSQFTAPLPEANYATMVVSTGGHWTVGTFNQTVPAGIEGVLNLFEHAMKVWLEKADSYIASAEPASRASWRLGPFVNKVKSKRRAVVRAYPPGHEDCHRTREPFKEVQPLVSRPWNWDDLSKFNAIFEKLLTDRQSHPNIHYLGIDRPARLRPDSHITGDCLHIMTGAGVLEGWTQYIWHYITKEL